MIIQLENQFGKLVYTHLENVHYLLLLKIVIHFSTERKHLSQVFVNVCVNVCYGSSTVHIKVQQLVSRLLPIIDLIQ